MVTLAVCSRSWTISLLSGVSSRCLYWNQWLAADWRGSLPSPWAVYTLPWQRLWQQVWLLWPPEVPSCVLVQPARTRKLTDMLATSWKNRYWLYSVKFFLMLSPVLQMGPEVLCFFCIFCPWYMPLGTGLPSTSSCLCCTINVWTYLHCPHDLLCLYNMYVHYSSDQFKWSVVAK